MWRSKNIIFAVKAHLVLRGSAQLFKYISIDSRSLTLESFFVAINGRNYKGINFLNKVLKNKILGIMIERNDLGQIYFKEFREENIYCLVVENTIYALGELSKNYRFQFATKVIGITGSIGKTSIRRLCTEIFKYKALIFSTIGNMNNLIGVSIMLLNLSKYYFIAILELGMDNLGEIKRLTEIAQPEIALISNIFPVHLNKLKRIDNVFAAKSEIVDFVKKKGSLILNIDIFFLNKIYKNKKVDMFVLGFSSKLIKKKYVTYKVFRVDFLLGSFLKKIRKNKEIFSEILTTNIIIATIISLLLATTVYKKYNFFNLFRSSYGRMYIQKLKRLNFKLLDDAYNSNPASLKNAAKSVDLINNNKYLILIVGDMLELGDAKKAVHCRIGNLFARSRANRCYFLGNYNKDILDGIIMGKSSISKFFLGRKVNPINGIKRYLSIKCTVLIKGSRALHMEEVIKGINIGL